jgi:hypothetical protein
VLEREAERSGVFTGHDERGDLDDLSLSSSGGSGLTLCTPYVVGGGDVVASSRCEDGE